MNIFSEINKKLEARRVEGNLRGLSFNNGLVDFYSNDYLGLARNAELKEIISHNYEAFSSVSNGATGSRLLSGNSLFYEELEQQLAHIFSGEAALIFNSGYMACQAVVATLASRGDTIIYDEYIHACVKDGARLSQAKFFSFRHNDLNDLENKIKKAVGLCYVVIETVYSMDGDIAPLQEIVTLCKRHNALLIVDEAHSTGIYGEKGSGLLCASGLHNEVFIRIYTFGKAMGVHGACVVSTQVVKEYLINFARAFIFTTALPLHSLVSIQAAFEFIHSHADLASDLFKNIELFASQLKTLGLSSTETSIQTVKIPGNKKVKQLAKALQQDGIDVRPIVSPTVKVGQERLRICLHNFNQPAEIEQLIQCIKNYFL